MPEKQPSQIEKYLVRFFPLLLRLYPLQFRMKFEREMQVVFMETIYSAHSSSEMAAIFVRELRDLPISLTKSWMGTLRFQEDGSIGAEDPVFKEIKTTFRKQKLGRIARIGATLVVLVLFYYGCSYTSTKRTIAKAKSQGVYPSAEEGMRQIIDRGYVDIQRTTIYYAGPDDTDGYPYVWYVVAEVYAGKRSSGSEMGRNGCDNPGAFFIETDEGWVNVSEGAIYFGRLAHWMEVLGLAGPGQSRPSIDRMGNHSGRFC